MGAGALAVDGVVLLGGELRPGEAVGRGEVGADREEGFHGVVEHVGPESGLFVEAQGHQGQMGSQAAPDRQAEALGGGEHPRRMLEIELRPGLIEAAEVELAGHRQGRRGDEGCRQGGP